MIKHALGREDLDFELGGESLRTAASVPLDSLHSLSLDGRIARSAASTDWAVAEHRAHTSLGIHVEDACRRPATSSRPPLTPRPGSVVLMACGSLGSRHRF